MRSTAFSHRPGRGLTDDWLTPPALLPRLGVFDLDPCCPNGMPWKTATKMICQPRNGLDPPYSNIEAWMDRLASHGNGIALVFARTETAWFTSTVWNSADAVLFLRGRIHFHHLSGERAKGNAGGPHVLVAYGMRNAAALHEARDLGTYLPICR